MDRMIYTHSQPQIFSLKHCIFTKLIMGNLHHITLLFCTLFIGHIHFGFAKTPHYNVSCIGKERRALMAFRDSLVDNANRLSSWIGEDCCHWRGITCNDRTGHVEKLDLHNPIKPFTDEYSFDANHYDFYSGNCLGGEINPSILELKNLNYLDLSLNDFSGIQIPKYIGSLKNMRYLNLSGAGFDGEIPHHLGNLTNLEHFYLGESPDGGGSYNTLTAKSLTWISGFASLKGLDLSAVNLNECHDWLNSVSMLPSLSWLKLRSCGVLDASSPPHISLSNLTSLVSLDLGSNNLNSSFPLWLFNLSSLAVLRLDSNFLQGPIPSMIEKLTSLSVLELSSNSFNSSLPNSLCNQTSLTFMNLEGNQLQGSLPFCLRDLISLTVLNLGNNQFGGQIPSGMANLKQLSELNLADNFFNCSIPLSFGQLTKLEFLYISHNQLNGELPSTLGQLIELQELDISYNSLTGKLSEFIFAKLKRLKLLSISANYFLTFNVSSQWIPPFQLRIIDMESILIGPQFPSWLETQRNVISLSMRNASISGTIPKWFEEVCSNMKTLDLATNKLTGSLISFPPSLQELHLSNNILTGPINLFGANYRTNLSLGVLSLHDNHFTGKIPDFLCNISSLAILSLANNLLTGRIPPCLGDLQQLEVLNLANNSFSGHIPSALGNLEQLIYLHLDRNMLNGVLPTSMKNLKLLRTLDLGDNQFTGTIPDWFGKEFSGLQFLRLQSNNFYGNISVHLCQLSFLQVLNLAQNKLSGHIPPCFKNFSLMVSDDKSSDYSGYSIFKEVLLSITKGRELEYSSNLKYVKSIILAGNKIVGEIPNELLDLQALQSLSLSNNRLSGRIPEKIGNLKDLESLDLALNQFSGPIPSSLATIDSLSYLNLSFNNLSGSIPSGNYHFQTLNDPSIFEGNSGLCGKPLPKSCSSDSPSNGNGPEKVHDDGEFEFLWFCAGIGPGFAVGLLGVLCLLHFKDSWRHAYFGFVEKVHHRVSVGIALKVANLRRMFS